jgi:hypothetical protein
MSCPRVIFIDTSVFDSQKYNFSSNAIEPFLKAVSRDFTLLVPDPVEREITRHIRDRCSELCKKLDKLESEYPFVSKWKEWPERHLFSEHAQDVLKKDWERFLGHFDVVRLGYNGIDFKEIMDWYEGGHAPFGPKKEKEFPDALSLAAIIDFGNGKLGRSHRIGRRLRTHRTFPLECYVRSCTSRLHWVTSRR